MQINQINAVSLPTDSNLPAQKNFENFGAAKIPKPKTEKAETPEAADKKTEKIEDLSKLKAALADHNISLRFSQDKDTKELVVNLVNDKTGESVLQIPSEVSLKLAADFVKTQGQFIDEVK